MDVFGAFQLCSIGILAAPVTVRLSRTYFFDPGRNIIFLWTVLILAGETLLCSISEDFISDGTLLAGLLSLTVEFYRIQTTGCPYDDFGKPLSPNAGSFPYDNPPSCNLTCSVSLGPFSPMRGGSANNIYVIPAPQKLTFGMATLLAAACCVPAILSLISMWNKILEINWKARFGSGSEDERLDELIEGTNGATIGRMKGVNTMVRLFLSVVEIPLFGAAVLAILIIGERNLFSTQVKYQTEPIRSIGEYSIRVAFLQDSLQIPAMCRPMGTHRWYCTRCTRLTLRARGSRFGRCKGGSESKLYEPLQLLAPPP